MPHEKVIIRPRDKPWMTGQIPKAVQKRDRLLKTYSKSVNHRPTSWDSYRVQRNLVVSLVRKAKINYNIKTIKTKLLVIQQFLPKNGGVLQNLYMVISVTRLSWRSPKEIFLCLIQKGVY